MDAKDISLQRMSDVGEANALGSPLARVAPFVAAGMPRPVREEPDDAVLMLRYRDGDVRAFEVLYARHKAGLYRYLMRLCRQPEVANDLFQEVWGKVIATRERYEPRAQFNTFLFRIAHNCAVDYFRRAGRRHEGRMDDVAELEESLPGNATSEPETQVADLELRESFRKALELLPDEQREVFLLYEESGLSLDEIGRMTGVAMETAKSRLRYAFRKLRASLQNFRPQTDAGEAES